MITTGSSGRRTTSSFCGSSGTAAFTAHIERCRTLKPSIKPGAKVWKRQFASDVFCSQGPWPDRVTSDSRSGCCSPGDSRGAKTRAPASRHSINRKAWGTTLRHSELYTAPRQLIGGLSESTGSSGQMRRARRRESRSTQGFCWGRRGLWRRGTRAKKRLAGYTREIERLKSCW